MLSLKIFASSAPLATLGSSAEQQTPQFQLATNFVMSTRVLGLGERVRGNDMLVESILNDYHARYILIVHNEVLCAQELSTKEFLDLDGFYGPNQLPFHGGIRIAPTDLYPHCPPGALKYTKRIIGDDEHPGIFIKNSGFFKDSNVFGKEKTKKTKSQLHGRFQAHKHSQAVEVQYLEDFREQGLEHPNICAYKGVVTRRVGQEEFVIAITYEQYDDDLFDLVVSGKILLSPSIINYIIDEAKKGLPFLHQHNAVHCDIRAANIFVKLTQGGTIQKVVVGDFDAVKAVGDKMSGKRAPDTDWPAVFNELKHATVDIDNKLVEKMKQWLEMAQVPDC